MNAEEYERVKREIGWHFTAWDVVFFVLLIGVLTVIVVAS